jgi:hypothetical protein
MLIKESILDLLITLIKLRSRSLLIVRKMQDIILENSKVIHAS